MVPARTQFHTRYRKYRNVRDGTVVPLAGGNAWVLAEGRHVQIYRAGSCMIGL